MTPPRYLTDGERRRILQAVDLTAVAAAFAVSLLQTPGAIRGNPVAWGILARYAGWLAGLWVVWSLMAHAFRAYEGRVRVSPWRSAVQLTKAGLVGGGLFLAVGAALGDLALEKSPSAAGLFLGLAVALPVAGRILYRLLLGRDSQRRPTLIAGTGEAAREAAGALREHGADTYRVAGFVAGGPFPTESADAPRAAGRNRRPVADGDRRPPAATDAGDAGGAGADVPPDVAPVLGTVDDLPGLIREHGVGTVVDALSHVEDDAGGRAGRGLRDVVDRCLEAGAQVEPMPRVFERLTGRVPLDHLDGAWGTALPLERGAGRAVDRAAKRAVDVALTSLGALVTLPLLPLVAAAIYLESPGPIFYAQERVGRGGEVITVFKLRSMVPDAEEAGSPVWATEDDDRVTRVGRVLRATHVDEFPQFLNILRGEMSIVGPRPERPEFVEELEREIPHYRARHALKPGLGGWGLVNQGYGSTREDARRKHEYDLYYLRHQSLWLDLVILARTFVDTLTLRGT